MSFLIFCFVAKVNKSVEIERRKGIKNSCTDKICIYEQG
jgi:hypothetical protein